MQTSMQCRGFRTARFVKAETTVRVLTNLNELEAIQPAWEDLFINSCNATVFASYDWVTTWFSVYHETISRLFIVVISDAQHVIALLPLYIRKGETTSAWFIGSGEPEASETCSEMQDVLLRSTSTISKLPPLSDIMRMGKVDIINLNNIGLGAKFILWCDNVKTPFVLTPIGKRYRALTNIENNALIKKTARVRKAAEKLNATIARVDDEKELEGVFETLSMLNSKRWIQKGYPPIFEDPLFKSFHKEILKRLLEANRLSLTFLNVGERILAVNYGIVSGNDLIFYQNGIDTSFKPNISPGLILHHEQLLYAKALGLKSYDFMMSSDDSSYKEGLTDNTEVIASAKIYLNLRHFYLQKTVAFISAIIKKMRKKMDCHHA